MMIHAVMGRLANAPVMIAADMGPWAAECLKGVASADRLGELMTSSDADDFWFDDDDWRCYYRPYKVQDGVLMIPIKGMLLHDFGYQLGSWATGYVYIRKAFERGLADPNVREIAMVINSGGGEVAGNFDLVDYIYNSVKGNKPIHAIVNEHAYSAAYSLASVADSITLPRTGGVGSIGVLTSHVDYSQMLENEGYKITLVFAGDHKVDGNSYEPLPKAVKNRMQARITGLYNVFTSTAARNLAISEEVIIGTQALTYSAEDAVEIGLAHAVASYDEALAAILRGAMKTETEDFFMSTKPEDVTAAHAAEVEAARAEGVTAGAQAERTRIQAILGSEEAKGRTKLANHLAMNTNQSADDAKAILAMSEAEAVAAPAAAGAAANAFAEAMSKTPNPEVGAESGKPTTELNASQQILADFKAATGQTTH